MALSVETGDIISNILGWIYFVMWSVSFYPQVYENWRRKRFTNIHNTIYISLALLVCPLITKRLTSLGLFVTLYVMFFDTYLICQAFNVAFYWSPYIQSEYEATHDGTYLVVCSYSFKDKRIWFN